MKPYIVLIVVLMLSGCAADLSTSKYVESNTFISERLPLVEIQVSEGFRLADSLGTKMDMRRDIGISSSSSKVKVFEARYSNENARALLFVSTVYTLERYCYFLGADFSRIPGTKIVVSEQVINGRRFDVATIQHVVSQVVFLQKVYSALYGEQTRLVIQVMQQLDRPMFDNPPYSEEAEKVLAKFNAFADSSFTIIQ